MDERELRLAFKTPYREPAIGELIARFERAFRESAGDTQTAMVAVNEVLEEPIPYEVFLNRMAEAS